MAAAATPRSWGVPRCGLLRVKKHQPQAGCLCQLMLCMWTTQCPVRSQSVSPVAGNFSAYAVLHYYAAVLHTG